MECGVDLLEHIFQEFQPLVCEPDRHSVKLNENSFFELCPTVGTVRAC